MDKVERVYTALRIHEPDKVPKGELQIHDELVAALLKEPLKDHFEAHVRVRKILHIDLINLGLEGGPPVELIGDTQEGYPVYRDWVGNEWVESGRTRRFLKHALDTAEKMNEFEAPNIDLFHASSVKRWVEHTDFCVFAQIGGVFDSVYPLMGLETYVKALYTCPEALRNVIEEVYRFDLKAIGLLAEAGAHVILVGDDLAYDSGPFLSLASLRKYVLPYLRGEVQEAKRHGLPAMLHSDGNITVLMKDIVDLGFNGVHSLQPSAGVNIIEIKRTWGSRICLMGNVDLDYLLTLSSPREVETEVKRLIREVAPGGGYILSTTNVLTRYVPTENAIAMYRTAEEFGSYPIKISE